MNPKTFLVNGMIGLAGLSLCPKEYKDPIRDLPTQQQYQYRHIRQDIIAVSSTGGFAVLHSYQGPAIFIDSGKLGAL